MEKSLLADNKNYWSGRAGGYSEVNQWELSTAQRQKWKDCLAELIREHFSCDGAGGAELVSGEEAGSAEPARAEDIRVLDIGCGPGFFAILLCELGLHVTAIDLTPSMIKEAKRNAGELAERITFCEMNAEALTFADESFDVVVSRNLTWNLPHPEKAYAEWTRVLRKGGLLLNFDANWYHYLFDEQAAAAYEQDRLNSAAEGVGDQNVGENFDVMEEIALDLPLSNIRRPEWDLEVLRGLGMRGFADENIWQRVWADEEKLNFASTPLFLVKGVKE